MTRYAIQSRELARELLIHRVADQPRRVAEAIRMLSYDLGRDSVGMAEQRDLAAAVQMDPGDCDRAIQDLEKRGILRVLRSAGKWWYELLPDSRLWQRREKRGVDDESIVRARTAWARIEAGMMATTTPDLPDLIERPAELARDGGFGAMIAESNREAAVANAASRYKPAPGALLAAVKQDVYGGGAQREQSPAPRPAVERFEDQGGDHGLGDSQLSRPAGPRSGFELGNSQSPESFSTAKRAADCEIPNRSASTRPGGLGNSQSEGSTRLGISQSTPPAHDVMSCHRGDPSDLMSHEDERGGAKDYDDEGADSEIVLESTFARDLYVRIERLLMPRPLESSFARLWKKRLMRNPQQVSEAVSDTECAKREGRIKKSVGGVLNASFNQACGTRPMPNNFAKR
ncbi:MAG: hypothetical protein V4710_01235 [Verrucomicrobiota bacterium]